MADPQDITLQPDGSVVDLRWAEPTAVVVEPTSGRKDTGFLNGDAPPDDDFNWMHRETGRWLRAMWSRYLKASDAFFSSWLPTGTDVYWVDVPAQPLKVFLSPDGVGSAVAVVWVDPEDVDTGAVQVQVTVPLADPQTLIASNDNYVFVPNTMIAPPTVTRVELAFLSVPINDPAPATPAGMVPVWKITTDAAAIDSVTLLLPETPSIKLTDFTDTVTITVGNDNALIATSLTNTTGVATLFITSNEGPAIFAQNVSATDAAITVENPIGKVFDGVGDWNLVGDADIDGQLQVTSYFIADSVLAYNGIVSGTTITAYGNITTYGQLYVGYDAHFSEDILALGSLTIPQNVTLCSGTGSFTCAVGTSSADTFTCNSTATFNAPVTVANGQLFTANGNTVLGNADTDTVTFVAKVTSDLEIGVSETTTLTVNSDTTFTEGLFAGVPAVQTTAGKLWYDGSNWRVGNGASVNTLIGVRTDYVVSDDTGAANDDLTGASVTMTITPDEWIFAKIEALQFRTDNATTCNIGIAATNGADTVTILNSGDADQAFSQLPTSTAVNQEHPNAILVRWKPTNDFAVPNNNNWTIYGRHGVSGGTLTSSNVYLQVWR